MVNKSWLQILRCFRERPGGVCFASSPKKRKSIYQISGIHVQSWHSGSLLSSWSKYLPSLRDIARQRKLIETAKGATFHEITYYQCAACIVSHHETSFSGWLIPTNAWRQLAKGSHTTSLVRANHACDKKHWLGSTNSPPKWFEIGWDEPLLILILASMSQQKLCRLNPFTLKDGMNCSWSEPGTYLSRRVALHTSAEFGHALHRSLCLDPLRRREPLQTNIAQEVERQFTETQTQKGNQNEVGHMCIGNSERTAANTDSEETTKPVF